MESKQFLSWGTFLFRVAQEVTNEELKYMKLEITDHVTVDEKKKLETPADLFQLLENKGLIGEDKTEFLRELLRNNVLLIGDLNEYEDQRRRHLELVSSLSCRRDPLFVGRDSYISDILGFFNETRGHQKVCCVSLWGMAGSGKTKLCCETGAIYTESKMPKPLLILIDLTKKTRVEDVGVALLNSVGRPVEADKYQISQLWKWMTDCQTEHVLLFDSADDLLKPSSVTKGKFLDWLEQVLDCHSTNVKIIITSRYAVGGLRNKQGNFKEIEVKCLDLEESVLLLTKSMRQSLNKRQGRKNITEEQAIHFAEHCGNHALALRTIACQLQMDRDPKELLRSLANPEKVERVLTDAGPWKRDESAASEQDSKQVFQCLRMVFKDMDQSLQLPIIRLAVLPCLFSQARGHRILADTKSDAGVEELKHLGILDQLTETGLLTRESVHLLNTGKAGTETGREAGKFYSLHPLVRHMCLRYVESDEKMRESLQAGLLSFFGECFGVLERFTRFDDHAFGNLQVLEREKTNLIHYLELETGVRSDGTPHPLAKYLPPYKDMLERSNIAASHDVLVSMERFTATGERELFFQKRAERAAECGDKSGWVNYMGWYAETLRNLQEYEKAEKAVLGPLKYCNDHKRELHGPLREGYSQCLYVKGLVMLYKPAEKHFRKIIYQKGGLASLNKSLKLRCSGLQDSIVTARTINAVGSCQFWRKNFDKALEHYNECKDMLRRLTQRHRMPPESHPDYAYYIVNVATCYHELGCKYMNIPSQKEKSKRYFGMAIDTYNEGWDLLRGNEIMEKSALMGKLIKNLAMTYCEMKEYEKALDLAEQATAIRREALGEDHPDVARAHYFTGSLHMSLGDIKRKGVSDVLQIEEYTRAVECFRWAMEVELKVGYNRRSMDYDELKRDMKRLLNDHLHKKTEWQRCSARFEELEEAAHTTVQASKRSIESDEPDPSDDEENPPENKVGSCNLL